MLRSRLCYAQGLYRRTAVRRNPLSSCTIRGINQPDCSGPARIQVALKCEHSRGTQYGRRLMSNCAQPGSSKDVQARSASNELLRRLVSADLESKPPSRQELKDLLYASEQGLCGLQPVQVTAWLERWTLLDETEPVYPEGRLVVVGPSREAVGVMERALQLLEAAGEEVGQRSRGRSRDVSQGAETFSPSLAAQLVYALGRGLVVWEGNECELVARLKHRLLPVALGEGCKGLRKLTAEELAGLVKGLANIYVVGGGSNTDVPPHLEAECLRRGLDKFKPADLANLMEGFRRLRYQTSTELIEAAQERMMRRGYLTKGRGGQPNPMDALRVLNALRSEGEGALALLHKVMTEGFREALSLWELVFALRMESRTCRGSVLQSEVGQALLRRLMAQADEWAGPQKIDDLVIESLLKLAMREGAANLGMDAAFLQQLVERWAETAHKRETWTMTEWRRYLRILSGFQAVSGKRLYGPTKARVAKFTRSFCHDGLASFDQWWQMSLTLQRLWLLKIDPGQDLVEAFTRHMDAMLSGGVGVNRTLVGTSFHSLVRLTERFELKLAPDFVETVLRFYCTEEFRTREIVIQFIDCIDKVCAASPRPSQPVVEALLRHIGDPGQLVEQACPGGDDALLARLQSTLDRLRGSEVAEPSAVTEASGVNGMREGASAIKQQAMRKEVSAEPEGHTGRQDRPLEVLWGLMQKGNDARGFSTPELESLIQGQAAQETDILRRAALPGIYGVVKEAMRPEQLQGLANHVLVPLVMCIWAAGTKGVQPPNRKALLDAWVDEVRMRGLAQVIQGPQDLASLFSALGRVGVEVEEALVVSLLAEVQSLGLESFSPTQLGQVAAGLALIPRADKLYGEELQALLKHLMPRADVEWLVDYVTRCAQGGSRPDAAYLPRLEEAIRTEGGRVEFWNMALLMLALDTLEYTPGQATLRAIEQVLLHGIPTGVGEQGPQEEKAREAMGDTALQQLLLDQCFSIMRVFLRSHYRWEPRLWDHLAAACLPRSIEHPVRLQLAAELRDVLADRLGTQAVGQDPVVPVLQWLWNAVGNQHLWDVPKGYLHVLMAQSCKCDTFPGPVVVRELLGHWVALTAGAGGKEKGHTRVIRGGLLHQFAPCLPKVASRYGLSGNQVLEMVDPLQAHLETLCAGELGPQVQQIDPVGLVEATQILTYLVPLSIVPRRRSTLKVLWDRSREVSFKFCSMPAVLALVHGLAAHDMHPGEQAVTRLVAHCFGGSVLKRVVEQVTDMQEVVAQGRQLAKGMEGGKRGAEGGRFLGDLLKECRRVEAIKSVRGHGPSSIRL